MKSSDSQFVRLRGKFRDIKHKISPTLRSLMMKLVIRPIFVAAVFLGSITITLVIIALMWWCAMCMGQTATSNALVWSFFAKTTAVALALLTLATGLCSPLLVCVIAIQLFEFVDSASLWVTEQWTRIRQMHQQIRGSRIKVL